MLAAKLRGMGVEVWVTRFPREETIIGSNFIKASGRNRKIWVIAFVYFPWGAWSHKRSTPVTRPTFAAVYIV